MADWVLLEYRESLGLAMGKTQYYRWGKPNTKDGKNPISIPPHRGIQQVGKVSGTRRGSRDSFAPTLLELGMTEMAEFVLQNIIPGGSSHT